MNDVMLFARLKMLGMPESQAWTTAARIRDVLHPVAAVAAAKLLSPRGLGLMTGAQAQNAPQVAKSVSDIGTGASLGATVGSVFPVVGTAIGAAVGAAIGAIGSLFGPAKEGQAADTWDNMVQEGYLGKTLGRNFDERYFAEAMKGAMDKGNNVWPQCGADGYKNPDCFYGPLSQTIVQGYLTKKVPLSATTAQVMSSVVNPWLQSGAAGLFKWAPYAAENAINANQQGLLVQGAVDRYLAGLPIVRSGMSEYAGQGYTVMYPLLNAALAPLLQTTAAPSKSPSVALAQAPAAKIPAPIAAAASSVAAQVAASPAPLPAVAPVAVISSVATPVGVTPATVAPLTTQQATTASIMSSTLGSDGINMVSPAAQQLVSDVAANGVQQTALGPPSADDLSEWILPGALIAGALLIYLAMKK